METEAMDVPGFVLLIIDQRLQARVNSVVFTTVNAICMDRTVSNLFNVQKKILNSSENQADLSGQ